MRILVLQHLEVEHPGIFRDFWGQDGYKWDAIELDEGEDIPSPDNYDLLVVMGGPMDVWQEEIHPWLVREKAFIRNWVTELRKPFLGVCLGHQLLAEALGGKVELMSAPEVGLADVVLTADGRADPLLKGLPEILETFQWHGAEISRLPEGAVILASNKACNTQAIRWGRHAYGLQFHVEITSSTVTDWEDIPAYKASLEQALGLEEAAKLAEKVNQTLGDFAGTARALYENFAVLIATERVA